MRDAFLPRRRSGIRFPPLRASGESLCATAGGVPPAASCAPSGVLGLAAAKKAAEARQDRGLGGRRRRLGLALSHRLLRRHLALGRLLHPLLLARGSRALLCLLGFLRLRSPHGSPPLWVQSNLAAIKSQPRQIVRPAPPAPVRRP